jgi:hypothetical protein
MKWFGIPVEDITAVVDGQRIRVGTVYEWADKSRREVFVVPVDEFDAATILRKPLDGGR